MFATFNELAEAELNDAIRYYENEQIGLGAAFLEEVRRCTAAIAEYPEAGPVVQGAIRRGLCDKCPYAPPTRCCMSVTPTRSGCWR